MFGDSPLEMVFIRAPRIERVGSQVQVIATEGGDPVAVRQGNTMAATFHPELSDDSRVHRAFLDLVSKDVHKPKQQSAVIGAVSLD
jgi:5'-phosphate synthase pdxT subunit